FDEALYSASWSEITVVLRWLAHFHARFLGDSGEGLWSCGTYWHLATRAEELDNIKGTRLHRFASLLDARLRCGGFPTVVHGDAKLANFLFTEDGGEVAAVDFQYVGRGAAMRDVAYFIGSCLSGSECERREAEVLEAYFSVLRTCLPAEVDAVALEAEWRDLYPVAWADFERFMSGWSPGHRKLTDYSDATTERAIEGITDQLMAAARDACLAAGRHIQGNRQRTLEVQSKGFGSRASDVVTQIDLEAQAIILEHLKPTIERYDLGVLAEEGEQDDSRLTRHAFWAIDPLDGTSFFIEGGAGYATSIALVTQSGEPLLGVVYDPVQEDLYQAVKGQGVTLNGTPLEAGRAGASTGRTRWFADKSLREHPQFEDYERHFDIRFEGGAVKNGLRVLTEPNSVYLKPPKSALGGCAIWDLAAVTLMLRELSGSALTYAGDPLPLNRQDSVYFNDLGLALTSPGLRVDEVFPRL
ncbi:MAG: inositol monophosphatase family protein, partial [Myxococcota bacterium]|nr:inositol monophosphatase family protein [Myxococcota bacterium]